MESTKITTKTTDQALLEEVASLRRRIDAWEGTFRAFGSSWRQQYDAMHEKLSERIRKLEIADKSWQVWERHVNELADRVGKLEQRPEATTDAVARSILRRAVERIEVLESAPVSSSDQTSKRFVELGQKISELSASLLSHRKYAGQQFEKVEALAQEVRRLAAKDAVASAPYASAEKRKPQALRFDDLVLRASTIWNYSALVKLEKALAEGRVELVELDK